MAEETLKRQLPIMTLKIFDRQATRAISSQNSERKRTNKKYAYMDSENITHHRREKRRYSEVKIKESPFKLFIESSRVKPAEYTLGSNQKVEE